MGIAASAHGSRVCVSAPEASIDETGYNSPGELTTRRAIHLRNPYRQPMRPQACSRPQALMCVMTGHSVVPIRRRPCSMPQRGSLPSALGSQARELV